MAVPNHDALPHQANKLFISSNQFADIPEGFSILVASYHQQSLTDEIVIPKWHTTPKIRPIYMFHHFAHINCSVHKLRNRG